MDCLLWGVPLYRPSVEYCHLYVSWPGLASYHCMQVEGLKPDTVKPVLRDHCHERPPALKDHTFLAEEPTFQYNWTCHQRPPVLTDHIFVANGVVFQDILYCNIVSPCSYLSLPPKLAKSKLGWTQLSKNDYMSGQHSEINMYVSHGSVLYLSCFFIRNWTFFSHTPST